MLQLAVVDHSDNIRVTLCQRLKCCAHHCTLQFSPLSVFQVGNFTLFSTDLFFKFHFYCLPMHINKTTTDDHILFVYLLALLGNKNMMLFILQT